LAAPGKTCLDRPIIGKEQNGEAALTGGRPDDRDALASLDRKAEVSRSDGQV
jgi:hypothetical protein